MSASASTPEEHARSARGSLFRVADILAACALGAAEPKNGDTPAAERIAQIDRAAQWAVASAAAFTAALVPVPLSVLIDNPRPPTPLPAWVVKGARYITSIGRACTVEMVDRARELFVAGDATVNAAALAGQGAWPCDGEGRPIDPAVPASEAAPAPELWCVVWPNRQHPYRTADDWSERVEDALPLTEEVARATATALHRESRPCVACPLSRAADVARGAAS